MSNIKKLMMSAASGDQPLGVEDVFQTFVYRGNGSSKSISNGINLNTTDTTGAFTSLTLNYYQTSPQSSYREFYLGKIIEDSSGNFYAIITFKENYNGYEQNTLTKFSSSGTQVWSKRLQDTSSPRYADFDDMVLNSNGDIVVTWTAASDNDRAKVNVLSASDGSTISGASNSATSTAPHNILHSGSSIYWTGRGTGSNSIFVASETAPSTVSGTRAISLGSYAQKLMLIPQSSGGPVVVGFNSDQNSGTSTNGWIFTKLASNLQSSTYTTRHSHSNGSSTQYNSRYMAGGKQYYDPTDNMLYIFWRGTNSISGNTSHYNYISKFDMDDGSHVVSKRVYFNSSSTSNIDATSITKFNNKIIACGSGYDSGTKQVILECSTDLSTISARTVTLPDYRDKLQIWSGTEKIYYMASDHGSHVEIRALSDFDIDTAVLGVTPTSSGITVTSASLTDTTTGYNNVSLTNGTATDTMNSGAGTLTNNTINMVESSQDVPEILEPSPGGMVWLKCRDFTRDHTIQDTERGANKTLIANSTYQEETKTDRISSFDFTGFTVSNASVVNSSNVNYCSWTFRKTEKFFDIVTYTGNGSAGRQISHNLGSTPGMIVIKTLDIAEDWTVYHRGLPADDYIRFTTGVKQTGGARYRFGDDTNAIAPTSTNFTVASNNAVNGSNRTYVAYLFAHNDGDGVFGPNGNQDIIKCGSYTGNGNYDGPDINLGFEPQWLLIKRTTSSSEDWFMQDCIRGLPVRTKISSHFNRATRSLKINAGDAEADNGLDFHIKPSGFQVTSTTGKNNANGESYIYVAIRRPMAIPESANDVFEVQYGNSPDPAFQSQNFDTIDMALFKYHVGTDNNYVGTRLLQGSTLYTNTTGSNVSDGTSVFSYSHNNSYYNSGLGSNWIGYLWKRGANFFDVVNYLGNSTAGRTVDHNLEIKPDMIWIKANSESQGWAVYHSGLGATKGLSLNTTGAANTSNIYWNNTEPTASNFTLNTSWNASNQHYTAYLFASLDGVAKVGSYTGTGTSNTDVLNIDCGFSNGARFVLIKRTDSTGNWWVFDTVRGITTASTDPVFNLDTSTSGYTESTMFGRNVIQPYSSGFGVTSFSFNYSGYEYIYYAIA